MKFSLPISAIALAANLVAAQDTATPVQPQASAPNPVEETTSEAPAVQPEPALAATAPVDSSVAVADTNVAAIDSTIPADTAVQASAEPTVADSSAGSAKVAAAKDTAAVAPKAQEQAPKPQPKLLTGTELKGEINGFLRIADSPYLVTEDITVNKLSALIIEPGVVLQFTPGTGLYIQGQIVAAGSPASKVIFRSAYDIPKNGDWKGIFISGEKISELRNTIVTGAEYGVSAENTTLNIRFTTIEKTTSRGVYAKNSKIEVSDCIFENNTGAALNVSSYSDAKIDRTTFTGNSVAFFNSVLASSVVSSSTFENNSYGILDQGNSVLTMHNSSIKKNNVGVSSVEVQDKSVQESMQENAADFTDDAKIVISALPEAPVIPGVESRHVDSKEKIGTIIEQKAKDVAAADTSKKSWNIIGNVMLGGNYHLVKTRKNHYSFDDVVGSDTIASGDHYKNYFQTPGLGGEASAYLLMQSPEGQTIEFNADLKSDSWNHFSPNPVTLTYKDHSNNLTLGDFQKVGGDIYMSSLPIFGAGYTLSLLKNNADQPLFEFEGFFGEARRSYAEGSRHPYIYNDYIEEGELQAQRIAYGGSFKWAPVRRFDATFGVIYADDEIDEPLLRKGTYDGVTSEPIQTSLTMYADGNWLFYPGDIELKGMVAVGRADTADVAKERAVNKVFAEAGLTSASYSSVRQLMNNESKISSLSQEELEAIFGDNTTLTRGEMRDSLRTLIRDAKLAKREDDSDIEDGRVMGLNWGSQNFAIGASLFWNIKKTTLSGHLKYIGEDYYSAGSADQLADTREFGGRLEQIITDFWTFGFDYQINVENAAKDKKTNLFGLGEGTRWGFFTDADQDWYEEHELDNDRTKYIQNFGIDNTFQINKNLTATFAYGLEYRTQYRPYQIHGDYILEDGIYQDEWFKSHKGQTTYTIEDGDYITTVDSARWAQYMSLANEDYLASKFQERIFKHTWKADFTLKAYKSTFRAGGRWVLRSDASKFYKDSLIQDMDLADTTWGKMGYYFGGADYFEQTYPISATTTLDRLQNRVQITPRFKSYTRDNMFESEVDVVDEFEYPFFNRFLILGLNGEFRYLTTSWDISEDEEDDETEMDVLGKVNLKVNHTKHLSSEWYTGTAMYYRPDNRSNEYKDVYFGINVNYVF